MSDGEKMAAYVAARIAYTEADAAADAVRDRLARAVHGIGVTKRDAVNRLQQRNFSPHNQNDWISGLPSAAEVEKVMTRWYETRIAVRQAFNALPVEAQKHVQGLPPGAE